MNLVDALLAADVGTVTKKQTKDYEVVRLSKVLGTPFVLKLQEITDRHMTEIMQNAIKMNKRGKVEKTDYYSLKMNVITEGVVNPEFTDLRILKRFKVATKKELLGKLLNSGERQNIYDEIQKLSGYNSEDAEEKVNEVKN